MSETTGDNEEDKKKKTEGESESGSSSSTSGFVRPASESTTPTLSLAVEEENQAQRKKSGEGDSESGSASTGTAYTRASGEGIAKLSLEKQKVVWNDFRHLDLNEVVIAVAEFFSEFPARASANLSVAWNNVGGYAIINMAIKFGQDVATAVRERTRESAVQVRRRYGINIKFKQRGGVGVTMPNPQAGLQ